MPITVTGRLGSREVILVRSSASSVRRVKTRLEAQGYIVTTKEAALTLEEQHALKQKINRLCRDYVLRKRTREHGTEEIS